ncbi:MAG: hypothetical protein WAU48_10170 [Gammaproteobacteria bacterium]
MKSKLIATVALLAIVPFAAFAADGAGHCSYTQKNMFAGPFKICDTPASADQCAVLGKTDDNSGPAHGDGDCPEAGRVGVCDRGADGLRYYYEGDPDGLEIGCGFQGGEWKAAAK